jgi:hypothetical protein
VGIVVMVMVIVVLAEAVAMWAGVTASAYRVGWRGPVTLSGDSQLGINQVNE